MPSFASIISVLSVVFYYVGFLRVELELHEQKKRINALESVVEVKSQPNEAYMKIIKNARGKYVLTNPELKGYVILMIYSHQNCFFPQIYKKKVVKRATFKANNK